MPRRYAVRRHTVTQPSDPSYRLIPLTRNQNAIVDAADFEWLSHYNWTARWAVNRKSFTAFTRIDGKRVEMHALLCSAGADHIDRNPLNNRRENLRPATPSQNQFNRRKQRNNTSGYKGVGFSKEKGLWRAYIANDTKKFIHLGYFAKAEDAARAYDAAAIRFHGEFACPNFPQPRLPQKL